MEWFVIGRDMHVLCNPSTDSPGGLPIDDSGSNQGQTITLTNNVAIGTYDFTTYPDHEDSKYITEGNYIAFRDKYGKDRLYTIMTIDGDDEWDVHCEDIGLDLINEAADPWNVSAEPIATTLDRCLRDTGWTIGINEIADRQRATKYEGKTDSHLSRIGMIMNTFEAECEFVIELNGAKVTKQVINIYKTLGEDKVQQRFIDDINLIALSRSGSIEDLCTCVICYGKEENDVVTTIADVEYDDGRYYSPKGHTRIYDREAHQKWSRFQAYDYAGQGEFDGYINGVFEYDTDSPQELFNRGLSDLKKRNEKKVSYEAELYDLKADIGDTIQIADNRYQEKIYLSARVQEVQNHYTVAGEDTGKLANYALMESKKTQAVEDMIKELQGKVVSIDHTEIAYQVGESGTEPPTGEWSSDPVSAESGDYLWTRTVTYYTNGSESTAYSVAKNGIDGANGKDGVDGKDGEKGAQGEPGEQGPQGEPGKDGEKGDKGDPGKDGTNGKDGVDGTDGEDGQMLYATCNTIASEVEKVANLVSGQLILKAGTTVAVKFSYSNSANNPTLAIAGTGAKEMYVQGVRNVYWAAGATVTFTYDGSSWRVASEPVYAPTAVIGNAAGFNVYIDGESVNVRKGEEELAKFQGDSIYLGEGGTGAHIYMGNMEIGADEVEGKTVSFLRSGYTRISTKTPHESGSSGAPSVIVNGTDTYVNNEPMSQLVYFRPRNVHRVAAGTKVVQIEAKELTSVQVLTNDEINTALGISDSSNANTTVNFSNGDGEAQKVHVQGATYQNGKWFAVFADGATAGSIRINYMITYFGENSGDSDIKVQEKVATPTFSDQTILPDNGYDYLSSVTIKAIPYTRTTDAAGGTIATIGTEIVTQTQDDDAASVLAERAGIKVQSKTVTPTMASQIIYPDEGYDYLSSVTIKAIPYAETEDAAGGTIITIG